MKPTPARSARWPSFCGPRLKTLPLAHFEALKQHARVVERDGHGDKVLLMPDGNYLKLFRRKRRLSSASWYPYAQRFGDNSQALAALGIPCPRVIEVFRVGEIERDVVHYAPLPGTTLRALIAKGLDSEQKQALRDRFNAFVRHLHDQGIYFRSLHLNNVVLTPQGELGLIDISDVRLHRKPLSRFWRARNLKRMQGIEGERDWLDCEAILDRR